MNRDSANYTRQLINQYQWYLDGSLSGRLVKQTSDNDHLFLDMGEVGLKFLSSGSQVQVRNGDDNCYRLGHMFDEVPTLLQRGDVIDLYALSAFQTKAIQELVSKINQLEEMIISGGSTV